jgi:peptidoglycan/xylan/chitin deacetylase (PgdA/CDA1 family)
MCRLLYALTGPGRGVQAILLYHSVGRNAPHSIPLPLFEQQMEILAQHFQVERLNRWAATFASALPLTNTVCVTFDDGYRDNYESALPVLERLNLKATFFIATGFLNKSFQASEGAYPMMTSAQVQQLAALGHEIGAHTVSHERLTTIPLHTARAEVQGSKAFLEDLCSREITSFAYPKGAYNEAIKTLVATLGFRAAVTTREGLVSGRTDRLSLPRMWRATNKMPLRVFLAKLSPAGHYYAQLRRQTK